MLTISKKSGANSTAGGRAKKGAKGRLELCAFSRGDGTYGVSFEDFGNYGRKRWEASFGDLNEDQVRSMIDELESLLDGSSDTTHVEFTLPPAPEAVAPAEELEATVEELELLGGDDLVVQTELPDEDTEQLEV